MLSPLPGAMAAKPGSCSRPLPGVAAEIVNENGRPLPPGKGGWLVIARPWPAMIRGIWGDQEAYRRQYWSQSPGKFFSGDGTAATKTATSGSWGESTTSSTSPVTA